MPDRSEETRASHVFVSYASVDRERVLPIVEAMRDVGIGIWLDQDDITGGTIYAAEIAAGIEDCRALVLMCSPASLTSHNVRQEIALAWKYRRPYLPLLLEPVMFPRELEYWLEGSQWIEIFDRPADVWLPKISQSLDRLSSNRARETSSPSFMTPLFDVPIPLVEIVGRDDDVRTIVEMVQTARLATLTGPGGTGKTRLALEVAHVLQDQPVGDIVFVDLAPIRDPDLVIATITSRLGIQSMGGQPVLEVLTQALARRTLLLVLDNFEQVVESAPDLATLLAGSPGLRILVTSRTPLRIAGEHEYPVLPLDLPNMDHAELDDLGQSAAVQMFVKHARAVQPAFRLTEENATTVAEICIRLDGLPLAIELAAARLRMLSPAALLERLDHRLPLLRGGRRDLPARQQTLYDTIAWSHDLLEPEDRVLFRRLSVFVGGWTLDAAEQVAGDDIDVLMGLDSLASHSLVRADELGDEPRYRMLETIREFALEQLITDGEEAELRERQATWVLALVDDIAPNMRGPGLIAAINRIDSEHANIRAALEWLIAHRSAEAGWRITGPLWQFWWMRGHLPEGKTQFDRLLALPREGVPDQTLASGLTSAGIVYEWLDQAEKATSLQEDALKIWDRVPFELRADEYWSNACLANIAMRRGDFERARRHAHKNGEIARQRNDEYLLAMATITPGVLATFAGNLAESLTINRRGLEHARRSGDPWAISLTLGNLTNDLMQNDADPDEIRANLDECIVLNQMMGHIYQTALSLAQRSELALRQERSDDAITDAQEALELSRRLGNTYNEVTCLNFVGFVLARTGQLGEAMAIYRESLGLSGAHGFPNQTAIALDGIAGPLHASGKHELATRLVAAASTIRTTHGLELAGNDLDQHERLRADLRMALSESDYIVEWAAGEAMSMSDSIEYALANS